MNKWKKPLGFYHAMFMVIVEKATFYPESPYEKNNFQIIKDEEAYTKNFRID